MKSKKKASDKNKKWEKDRRDRLNQTFVKLSQLLPQYDPSATISKVDILQKSIHFIEELQEKIKNIVDDKDASLKKYFKDLEDRIELLLGRNSQLADLLRKAKITIPQCKYGLDKLSIDSNSDSIESALVRPKALTNKISEDEAKKLLDLENNKLKTMKPPPKKKKENVVNNNNKTSQADSKTTTSVASETTDLIIKNPANVVSDTNEKLANGKDEIVNTSVDKVEQTSPTTTATTITATVTPSIGNLDNTCLVVSHNQIVGTLQKTVLSSNVKVTPALVSTPIMTTSVLISNNGSLLQMPIVQSTTTTTSTSLLIVSNDLKKDDGMKCKVVPGKVPIPALKNRIISKKKLSVKVKKVKEKTVPAAKSKAKKRKVAKTATETNEPELKKPLIEEKVDTIIAEEKNKPENVKLPEPLNLNQTDLSNDIFESFQAVTENGTNHESLSPTAAYLMTFPLVAPPGGKNVDNSIPEDNETANLIQNDVAADKDKVLHQEDRDLSENANLILDNFSSFFGNNLYPNTIDTDIVTPATTTPVKTQQDTIISSDFVQENDNVYRAQKLPQTSSYQSIDAMIETKTTPNSNYHRPYNTYPSGTTATTTATPTKTTVSTNCVSSTMLSQSYDSNRNQNMTGPNFSFSLSNKATATYTDNFNNLPRTAESASKPITEFTFSLSNTTNTQSSRAATTMPPHSYYPVTSISSNSNYNFLATTMCSTGASVSSAITTSTSSASMPNYFTNNNFSKTTPSVFDYNNLTPFDASINFTNQPATNFTFSLTTSTSKTLPKYTTSKSNYDDQLKSNKKLPATTATGEINSSAHKLHFSTAVTPAKQQFPQYMPNSKYYATDTTITNYPKYQPTTNSIHKAPIKIKTAQAQQPNHQQVSQSLPHQQQPVQQQQQFSSKYDINWMTSSDFKPTTPDFSSILPPIDFTQNLCSGLSTPCSVVTTVPTTTATVPSNNSYYPNFDLNRKSDIFFAHPPGEENLPWSPNKLSNILDTPHLSSTNHYFPTTLQHLEGDLALHTPSLNVVPPPASSLIGNNASVNKKCDTNKLWNQNLFNRDNAAVASKKTNKPTATTISATTAGTSTNTTTLSNNTNFLSVRQLVDNNEKNYSNSNLKMSNSQDKQLPDGKTMKAKDPVKKSGISVANNLFSHNNAASETTHQINSQSGAGIPNIYSAESLIGNSSSTNKKSEKSYNSDVYNYLTPTIGDSATTTPGIPNLFSNLDFGSDQNYNNNYSSSTRYNNQNFVSSFVDNTTPSSYSAYHSAATHQLNPTFPPPPPSTASTSAHNQNLYQLPSTPAFSKTQNTANQFYPHSVNHDITSYSSSSYLQSNDNTANRSKITNSQKFSQHHLQTEQQQPQQQSLHSQSSSALNQKPRKPTKNAVTSLATDGGAAISLQSYHHPHHNHNSSNNLLSYDFPAPVVSPASYFSVPMGINSPSSSLLSTPSTLPNNHNIASDDHQSQQQSHNLQQPPYNYHNFNYSSNSIKNSTFNGMAGIVAPPPPLSSSSASSTTLQTAHHPQQNHNHHTQRNSQHHQNQLQLHPISNSNTNSGSQTLTNFNLSTICPEINHSDKVRQQNW